MIVTQFKEILFFFIDIMVDRKSKVKKNIEYSCFYWTNSVLQDKNIQKYKNNSIARIVHMNTTHILTVMRIS